MSSNLEDNIGNPMAPIVYSVSTLHCLAVSLVHDGAERFTDVAEHGAPGDPMHAVFVSQTPG